MKRIAVIALLAGLIVPSVHAQFGPVQITIQPITKKHDSGESATASGNIVYLHPADYSAKTALKITLKNSTPYPLTGLTLRWGVVKSHVSEASRGGSAAYGGEETVDLPAHGQKIIETAAVEASGQQFASGDARGEKIRGHGAQVLQNGKVIAEQYVPPTIKNLFDNLRPVGEDKQEASGATPPGNNKKKKKSE